MADRFYVREFLNREGLHGGAYILASVEDTTLATDRTANAFFELADCSRRIDLDFGLYSRHERENSLAKADRLVDAITAFRDALRIEADLAAEREAQRKESAT